MSLISPKKKAVKFTEEEIKILQLIRKRRLQMLVHSCIYYRYGNTLIEDSTFDKWAYELVALQNKYPELAKQVRYHEVFKDFDGHTGYHLPMNEPSIMAKAEQLIRYDKGLKR